MFSDLPQFISCAYLVFAKAELGVTKQVKVPAFSHTFLLLPHAGTTISLWFNRSGRTHHWTHYNNKNGGVGPARWLAKKCGSYARDRWRWSHCAARNQQEEEVYTEIQEGLPINILQSWWGIRLLRVHTHLESPWNSLIFESPFQGPWISLIFKII